MSSGNEIPPPTADTPAVRRLGQNIEIAGTEAATAVSGAVADATVTRLVTVEACFASGFSGMSLLGPSGDQARGHLERVRISLEQLGLRLPARKLVVSVMPAEGRREGSQLDLPVAVAVASLIAPARPRIDVRRFLFTAELSLSGRLRPVRAVVSHALTAMSRGLSGIIVAAENMRELSILGSMSGFGTGQFQTLGFQTLSEVLGWVFQGRAPDVEIGRTDPGEIAQPPGFDDVVLTPETRLLVTTVAAGMHSAILRGTPGTGKSLLASRIPSIAPPLVPTEQIEVMKLYSAAMDRVPAALLHGAPPMRSPHHQASAVSILGGPDMPGELSLAHHGFLFLDEIPEFRRDLLEALREPLETGEVRVARTRRRVTWPASVSLIAACNNCPCGWFASARRLCVCPHPLLLRYRQRLSGPVLDRIDIHVNMPEEGSGSPGLLLQMAGARQEEDSTHALRFQVAEARERAVARNRKYGVRLNRDLPASVLVEASGLAADVFERMVLGVVTGAVSTRALTRAVRVARTIADLERAEIVGESHLRQAWQWQALPAAIARGEALP